MPHARAWPSAIPVLQTSSLVTQYASTARLENSFKETHAKLVGTCVILAWTKVLAKSVKRMPNSRVTSANVKLVSSSICLQIHAFRVEKPVPPASVVTNVRHAQTTLLLGTRSVLSANLPKLSWETHVLTVVATALSAMTLTSASPAKMGQTYFPMESALAKLVNSWMFRQTGVKAALSHARLA